MGCINIVSLREQIFPSADTYKKLVDEEIEKLVAEYEVEGLDEILFEIKNRKKAGYFERFYHAYSLGKKIYAPGYRFNKEEKKNLRLYNLASHVLRHFNFTLKNLVDFSNIKIFYIFLDRIYYMNLGRKLDHEDLFNLYFSKFHERIIFNLDRFDEVSYVPEVSDEFLFRLKKIKWRDKKTDNFFEKLRLIRGYSGRDLIGPHLIFETSEDSFLLTLAACSAVSGGRDDIINEDVIRAFKTYFKLLKTDITQFKAKPERIGDNGYLVCDKCNEYYKLQSGESPDDFTDECECGGKLKFYGNINWLLESGDDVGVDD